MSKDGDTLGAILRIIAWLFLSWPIVYMMYTYIAN